MYEKEHTSVTENAGKPENERLRESLSLQDRADLFLSLNREAERLGPIEVFEDKYDFVIRDYPLNTVPSCDWGEYFSEQPIGLQHKFTPNFLSTIVSC